MNDDPGRTNQSKGFLTKLSQFLSNEPSNKKEIIDVLKAGFDRGYIEPESYSIIQGGLTVNEMQVRDSGDIAEMCQRCGGEMLGR